MNPTRVWRDKTGDRAALEVRCDPHPLTAISEALALLAGRRTVALIHHGGRLELETRDHWQIAGRPAGTGHFDVLAEHVCGTRPGWPTTATIHARPQYTQPERIPY